MIDKVNEAIFALGNISKMFMVVINVSAEKNLFFGLIDRIVPTRAQCVKSVEKSAICARARFFELSSGGQRTAQEGAC